MATLVLTPEDQLHRLAKVVDEVQKWQALEAGILTFKPEVKQWSILEILGHMNAAYRYYEVNILELLHELPDSDFGYEQFEARWLQRKLIRSFRPQNGRRRYKMQTTKKFKPSPIGVQPDQNRIAAIFDQFFTYQRHLKSAILESRKKDVAIRKFDSALGPVVQFYLPEAFDFLISHEERHLQQAREMLTLAKTSAVA